VTAIDFSGAALDKARRLTEAEPPEVRARLTWRQQDLTEWEPEPVAADLVLIAYLHLAATDRRRVLHASVDALRQGGVLLVIGHDRTNIEHGTGGPQEPDLLYTPDDLNADLADRDDLEIELAQTRNRPVDGADRPALDVVWRARRRGSA
jgi:SAM-dependent methyltransferase